MPCRGWGNHCRWHDMKCIRLKQLQMSTTLSLSLSLSSCHERLLPPFIPLSLLLFLSPHISALVLWEWIWCLGAEWGITHLKRAWHYLSLSLAVRGLMALIVLQIQFRQDITATWALLNNAISLAYTVHYPSNAHLLNSFLTKTKKGGKKERWNKESKHGTKRAGGGPVLVQLWEQWCCDWWFQNCI